MKSAILLNIGVWIGASILCIAVAMGIPGLGLGLFGVFVLVWSMVMLSVRGHLG